MSALTPAGWILYAAMWVDGPVAGYTASRLIASAWEGKTVERNEVVTVGLFGGLLVIAVLMLLFAEGL